MKSILFGKAPVLLVLGGLLFLSDPALAREKTHQPVAEMLKGMKRAGVCKPDDALPPTLAQGRNEAPDFSCGVDAAAALTWVSHPGAVVIDTRNAAEYAGFHINGALNLGADAVRTKPYLKEQKLLLVGNGKAERELYIACAGLKRAGFKQVRLLRGGMPAWLAQSHPVLGQPGALAVQTRLTAAELWTESRFDANTVILTPAMVRLKKEFPGAIVLGDDGVVAIKAQAKKRRRGSQGSLVLVTGPNWANERIEQLIQALKPVPVVVFVEKPETYQQYQVTQEAVWKARARGPKKLKCG